MKRTFFLFASIVLVSGALGTYAVRRDAGMLNRTGATGDEIVRALERFHSDSAYYPGSLGALVPTYIEEVPSPEWGIGTWRYRTTRDLVGGTDSVVSGFELGVGANESLRPLLRYRTSTRAWDLED